MVRKEKDQYWLAQLKKMLQEAEWDGLSLVEAAFSRVNQRRWCSPDFWLLGLGLSSDVGKPSSLPPLALSACLWVDSCPERGKRKRKEKKQKQKQTPLFLDKGDLRFQFLTYCKFENTCFSIVHNKIIIWLVMEFSFGKKHPCILKKRVVFQFAE